MTDEWEYRVVPFRERHGYGSDHIERALNEEGRHGWRLVLSLGDDLVFEKLKSPPKPPPPTTTGEAVSGSLSIGGNTMGLTVDTTPGSESVTYAFEDDHGNQTELPNGDGSGIAVAFTSSDETLATVGTAVASTTSAGNPAFTAPITVVTTVPADPGPTFSGAATNVDGSAITTSSGAAWEDPAPSDPIPVAAGEPVEGVLSVADTAAV